MARKNVPPLFLFLFFLAIFLSLTSIFFDYILLGSLPIPFAGLTGHVTGGGTVTLTQAGTAGIQLTDSAIAYGSGYYNATCTTNSSTLDSNISYGNGSGSNPDPRVTPYCWFNTTTLLTTRDWHTLMNNGSSMVNVSAIADKHGEDWLCGGNCPFTNLAQAAYLSYSNETNSCLAANNLTNGYEAGVTFNTNITIGICDRLDFADGSDTVDVFVNTTVPKDATTGAKTLTITYEALAL